MFRLFKALPWAPKYTTPPITVALLLLFIYFLPEPTKSILTFERTLIIEGQWWRVMTGQWVHWGLGHVVMNVAGVWLVWLLFAEFATGWRYGLTLVLIGCASSIGMLLLAPSIEYYVGFSGVLYGLFAWGSVQDIKRKVPFGWLLFIGVVTKVSYELIFGTTVLIGQSADNLAVAAHFYGVVGGIVLALVNNQQKLFE